MKVSAYHTESVSLPPEVRAVHHDQGACTGGVRIADIDRHSGSGGKPRCKECISLDDGLDATAVPVEYHLAPASRNGAAGPPLVSVSHAEDG